MNNLKAKFYETGRVEFYNSDGKLLASGIPDREEGQAGYSPYVNFACALMQYHGDWPNNPKQAQEVTLRVP